MISNMKHTSIEIMAGESVTWRNLQRKKVPIIVVSKEGMWEPQTVYYDRIFSYTFDKPGTYTFMLEGTHISGTVVVV